jgi:hypothetical protein
MQEFLNFGVYQNPLESLSKHKCISPLEFLIQ